MEINRGVIPGHKKSDWIAGSIPFEVRNLSGDWTQYLVKGEWQMNPDRTVDNLDCVSEAVNNVCEIQYKQQTGIEINKSDRQLAKTSGTTKKGNWVYIVIDSARLEGVVDEEEWPRPPGNYTWDDYYAPIPDFILARRKKQSLDKYILQSEVITDLSAESIKHHLQHAPLLFTLPGHEVSGIVVSIDGNTANYFDSYEPFIKTCNINQITDIYKLVLTIKNMPQFKTQNKNGELRIILQAGTMEEWAMLCKVYGIDPKVISEYVIDKP